MLGETVLKPSFGQAFSVLKVSSLYPFPKDEVQAFLAGCKTCLVLEDNEPYLEQLAKAEARGDYEFLTAVRGKLTGHVQREGELYRHHIDAALRRFVPTALKNTVLSEVEPCFVGSLS